MIGVLEEAVGVFYRISPLSILNYGHDTLLDL